MSDFESSSEEDGAENVQNGVFADSDNDDDEIGSQSNSSEIQNSDGGVDASDDDDRLNAEFGDSIKLVSSAGDDQSDSEGAVGAAVKQQLELWIYLLSLRIKLQKILTVANQLPSGSSAFSYLSGREGTSKATVAKCRKSLILTFRKLVAMQNQLYANNSATKSLLVNDPENSALKSTGGSDDEIPFDSDAEEDKPKSQVPSTSSLGKLKLNKTEQYLDSKFEKFRHFEHKILRKWKEKTRLAQRSGSGSSKGFAAFDSGDDIVKQIDKILADQPRLINRTRLNRSGHARLGVLKEPENPDLNMDVEQSINQDAHVVAVSSQQFDDEIFDDSDFYQTLLRELIEKKLISDSAAVSSHLQNLQALRSKPKRQVDTKASKGRKINYSNQEKLTNFMAPVNKCALSDDLLDELYGSLFRKPDIE